MDQGLGPATPGEETGKQITPMMVDFLLPKSGQDNGENPFVESLPVFGEWTIVAK